jgi:hypothetical protein
MLEHAAVALILSTFLGTGSTSHPDLETEPCVFLHTCEKIETPVFQRLIKASTSS